MKETRESVLKQFENGGITIKEAERLLAEIEMNPAGDDNEAPLFKEEKSGGSSIPADSNRLKWAWIWLLRGGTILTLAGAFGVYNGYQSRGLLCWFSAKWKNDNRVIVH